MPPPRIANPGSSERTVRELGGEIWAQLRDIEGLDWELANRAVDEIMGVLARHAGHTIVNDADLPVTPSEPPFPPAA